MNTAAPTSFAQAERDTRAAAIREAASRVHLSRDKRAALDALITHCQRGPARLSLVDLGNALGLSRRTLQDYIALFASRGWIDVRRVEGEPSVYALGRAS